MTLADSAQALWEQTVRVLAACRDLRDVDKAADDAGLDRSSLRRKMLAISFCLAGGRTLDEVCAMGQKKCLALAGEDQRKRNGAVGELRFRVPVELKYDIEKLLERMKRAIGESTSEGLWTAVYAYFADQSDAEIKIRLVGKE